MRGCVLGAEVTVARGLVFDKRGYMRPSFGSISDIEFSRRAATYEVKQLYFNQTSRFEEENYGWTPDYHFAISTALPETRLGDFVLYVGEVTLPFGSVTTHSRQTYGESYRWGSAEYGGTFDYVAGDKVTVCLTDAAPNVTLVLTPDSVSENDGSSTVTATVEQGSADPFTVTVSAEPVSPAGTGDFILSTNKVLTFAANATVSTGTVTITAVDNKVHTPVDTPDKTVKVSGELSSGARPTAPADVELTITDDDPEPVLSLSVDPDEISEAGVESSVTVSTGDSTFADAQTVTLIVASESTATETDDFTVSSKSLTLGAGESSVTATVTAVQDTFDEEDESILVIGTHNNIEVGRQRITITDDDSFELTVELSDVVIDEAGGKSTVTVKTGDVTFADDQTITLALSGTATETDDYTVTKELTLDAGASSVTTTVTAVQDTFDDDGETIGIKATHGESTESA